MSKKYIIMNEMFEISDKSKPEEFVSIAEYTIGIQNGYCKEIALFDTEAAALEGLKNYKCTYRKEYGCVGWAWKFDAYYLLECEPEEDECELMDFADVEYNEVD